VSGGIYFARLSVRAVRHPIWFVSDKSGAMAVSMESEKGNQPTYPAHFDRTEPRSLCAKEQD
jgi:hypothetical protein